jgi:hypothetical protein
MASESIFGRIVVASQIEDFVMTTLSSWWDTYQREVKRQLELDPLLQIPLPQTYATRNQWETFPDERMPMVIVVSPGTVGETETEGDGKYGAWYAFSVGIAASARDENTTRFLAAFYGAVARAIMVQKGRSHWVDESFDDLVDPQAQRRIRAAYESFMIFIEDVVSRSAGPAFPVDPDPTTQPGSTWPTANTVVVDVIIKSPTDDVKG